MTINQYRFVCNYYFHSYSTDFLGPNVALADAFIAQIDSNHSKWTILSNFLISGYKDGSSKHEEFSNLAIPPSPNSDFIYFCGHTF